MNNLAGIPQRVTLRMMTLQTTAASDTIRSTVSLKKEQTDKC